MLSFHGDFPVINANLSITGFLESMKLRTVLLNWRVTLGNYTVIVHVICQIVRVTTQRVG